MNDPTLAYLLIALGLLVMAAELFVPTGGVLFVVGLAGLITGVVMTFRYDRTQGVVTLVILCVVLPVVTPLLIRWWPSSPMGRRMMLGGPEDDAAVAQMPVTLELEQLRGRYGKTVSPLRPSGLTEFDGRRIDTLSEGGFIDAGRWVRCIDVRAGAVVVREVSGPPDLEALDSDEFKA